MKGFWQTVVVVLCLITALVLLQPKPERVSAQAAPAGEDVASGILRQQPLGPLLGKQILVIPTAHEAQEGKLETYDAQWVRLRTKDGNVRCYSTANVVFIGYSEEAPKP